jgi:hypothetical protein
MGTFLSKLRMKNGDKEFERYIQSLHGVTTIERLYSIKKAANEFLKNNKVSKEKQNVFSGIYSIIEKNLRK